jgi:hypothetical protein
MPGRELDCEIASFTFLRTLLYASNIDYDYEAVLERMKKRSSASRKAARE